MINGKTFSAKSYKRKISISFSKDSIFHLTNIFHCDDIKYEYRVINIKVAFSCLHKLRSFMMASPNCKI